MDADVSKKYGDSFVRGKEWYPSDSEIVHVITAVSFKANC